MVTDLMILACYCKNFVTTKNKWKFSKTTFLKKCSKWLKCTLKLFELVILKLKTTKIVSKLLIFTIIGKIKFLSAF